MPILKLHFSKTKKVRIIRCLLGKLEKCYKKFSNVEYFEKLCSDDKKYLTWEFFCLWLLTKKELFSVQQHILTILWSKFLDFRSLKNLTRKLLKYGILRQK